MGEASPNSTEAELANVVGRPVLLQVHKDAFAPGDVGLSLENVSLLDANENIALDHVNLDVHKGEIVAIAGVQGNGQSELADVILGLQTPNEKGRSRWKAKN